MAKVQSRRSISVRGATYANLQAWRAPTGQSISDFVEDAIARHAAALGLKQAREPGPRVPSRVRENGSAQRPSPAPPSASVPALAAPQVPPAAVRPNVHRPALPLASSAVAPERREDRGTSAPRSGNAPPPDFRIGAWVRRAPLRVAAVVPPIPEGSDGEPVREHRTKVKVSKGGSIW